MTNRYLPKTSFISPRQVLAELGVHEGDTVVDYGSGAGHWTLAAAKITGPKGKVIAIDNDEGLLGLIRGRAEMDGNSNIETILADLDAGNLQKEISAEVVIVANILYSVKDRAGFIQGAAKLVDPEGRLVFVDWHPGKKLFGPRAEQRVTEEDVVDLFEKAGLHLTCTVDTGHHHYGLVFDHKGEGCDWRE